MKKFLLFAFLLSAATAQAQVNLTNGLIAYYPFDGNASDSSGNELHGTINGATLTQDRFGNNNAAYQFSGSSNSFILVEDNNLLAFGEDYSFSLWFYKDTSQVETSLNGLFYKGRDVENSTGFALLAGNKEYFYIRPDETYVPGNLNPNAASFKKWHHAVGILKSSSVPASLTLYIDGKMVDTRTVPTFTASNDYPLVFGRHFRYSDGSGGYEYPFTGKMDEVRFYNRVLNAAEIDALYKQTALSVEKPLSENSGSIKVYPNPVTNGKLNIYNPAAEKIDTVILTDLSGQQVLTVKENVPSVLDVSGLPAGIYTISIKAGTNVQVSKIILQ